MVRPSIAVVLFLAAVPALAGTVIPGPERLVGPAALGPWQAGFQNNEVALATDGYETLVALRSHRTLFVTRLGPDGRPLTPVPVRLFDHPGGTLRATWIDGTWTIFLSLFDGGLYVVRLTRELELIDRRLLFTDMRHPLPSRIGNEFVVHDGETAVRVRSDFTPISAPVKLPEVGRVVPAPDGRFAVLLSLAPAPAMRLYDGRAFGELMHAEGEGSQMVWSGSEFVLVTGTTLQRYDRDLRPLGAPVKLAAKAERIDTLTVIGDDTVWVTWKESSNDEYGQRFRRGEPLDQSIVALPDFVSKVAALPMSDGRLLLVDAWLRMTIVPPPGGDRITGLALTPAAYSASFERLFSVAVSATEIAIARHQLYGLAAAVTVLSHDLAPLRESPVPAATYFYANSDLAMATDGGEFFTFDGRDLRRVDPAATLIPIRSRGAAAIAIAWTGAELVTAWNDHLRLERITREGEILLPCADKAAGDEKYGVSRALMAVGGNEVLVSWGPALVWFRDGCPITDVVPEPMLGDQRRLAWQDGRWAAAFIDENDKSLRVAFTRTAAAFTPQPNAIARDVILHDFSAAANGGWAVLYERAARLFAALLDRNGNVVASGVVTDNSTGRARLATLPDGRLLAVYTRSVSEPPYLGVSRVAVRFLTVEERPLRRRGARH